MYSGESISSIIQLDKLPGFLNPVFLTARSAQMAVTTLYHSNISNPRTTIQKTKNPFMAHLECERQTFIYYYYIQ